MVPSKNDFWVTLALAQQIESWQPVIPVDIIKNYCRFDNNILP